MAARTKQSLLDGLGFDWRGEMEKCWDAPITRFGESLPPGIRDGEADVLECGLKEKDGVVSFQASATVVHPEVFEDKDGKRHKVFGRRTRIYRAVPAGEEEGKAVFAKICEDLRLIAGDEFLKSNPGLTVEELCELVTGMNPPVRIRFTTSEKKQQIDPRTGKPKLNPKTGQPFEGGGSWENWNGNVESPDDLPNALVEASHAKLNGHSRTPTTPRPTEKAATRGDDVAALVARAKADNADVVVIEDLAARAIKNGYTREEFDNADWPDVEKLCTQKKPTPATEKPETFPLPGAGGKAEPDAEPEVGSMVKYAPPSPTNPKRRLKASDCEVTAVNTRKHTATLLSQLDRETVYTDVPWSDLSAAF